MKVIAAGVLAVLALQFAACATETPGVKISSLQSGEEYVSGYTTTDREHHSCRCRASLAGNDIRFSGVRTLATDAYGSFKKEPFSYAVPVSQIDSLDLIEPHTGRSIAALLGIGIAVIAAVLVFFVWG